MPEMLITPGTFAPVGPAVESGVALGFPRTPVQTLRKVAQTFQWATMPTQEESSPLPVNAVDCDFVTGSVSVRVDTENLDLVRVIFRTQGARYVTNDVFLPITGRDATEKIYLSSLPEASRFTPAGLLDLGTVVIEYGGDEGMPSNFFFLDFDADVSITGDDLPEVYNVVPDLTGGIISASIPHFGTGSDGWLDKEISGTVILEVKLRIGTDVVDAFLISIPVTGVCVFQLHADVMVPGSTLPIPRVDSGLTLDDALYGLGANPTTVSAPTIPYDGYRRYGTKPQGTLNLP